MKKILSVVLILGLVTAVTGPGEAAKKKKKQTKRTVEHEYLVGSPGVSGVGGACLATYIEQSGCVNIATGPKEKYVSVEVVDAAGYGPAGILAQNTDEAAPGFEVFAYFCGSTTEPVAITPGLELRVSVYMTPTSSCAGTATHGSITATLSSAP